MCNAGPFIFARHARFNNTIAQASRDAGYAASLEQVVPELGLRKKTRQSGQVTLEEAFLDVELFGHPTAPDRLLDATVRHPAAKGIVKKAASQRGAAASEGAACKEKRYPPRAGKSVIPCALESWGFADVKVINLLDELAVLAWQRQRDRGLVPTRSRRKWLTSLSVGVALDVSKSILAALPVHARPCCPLPLVEVLETRWRPSAPATPNFVTRRWGGDENAAQWQATAGSGCVEENIVTRPACGDEDDAQ